MVVLERGTLCCLKLFGFVYWTSHGRSYPKLEIDMEVERLNHPKSRFFSWFFISLTISRLTQKDGITWKVQEENVRRMLVPGMMIITMAISKEGDFFGPPNRWCSEKDPPFLQDVSSWPPSIPLRNPILIQNPRAAEAKPLVFRIGSIFIFGAILGIVFNIRGMRFFIILTMIIPWESYENPMKLPLLARMGPSRSETTKL